VPVSWTCALDIRDEALKPAADGKIPIVPGKPEQSEIIQRIFSRINPASCRRNTRIKL